MIPRITSLRANEVSEAIYEPRDCFGVCWDVPRNDEEESEKI